MQTFNFKTSRRKKKEESFLVLKLTKMPYLWHSKNQTKRNAFFKDFNCNFNYVCVGEHVHMCGHK